MEGLYRLSGLQEGMLFHGLYEGRGRGGSYVTQMSFEAEGLEVGAFKGSWAAVLRRHSILRSGFYAEGLRVPVQCVYREVRMPVAEADYRGMKEEEQEGAIRAYEEADRERGFDFGVAPLMRVSLLRIGEGRWRVLWTVHHLLLDGWSKSVLMEEFLRTYEGLVRGEEMDHPGEEGAEGRRRTGMRIISGISKGGTGGRRRGTGGDICRGWRAGACCRSWRGAGSGTRGWGRMGRRCWCWVRR